MNPSVENETRILQLTFANRYPEITPGLEVLAVVVAQLTDPIPDINDRIFLTDEDGTPVAVRIDGRDFFYSKGKDGKDTLDTVTFWCERMRDGDSNHKLFPIRKRD